MNGPEIPVRTNISTLKNQSDSCGMRKLSFIMGPWKKSQKVPDMFMDYSKISIYPIWFVLNAPN